LLNYFVGPVLFAWLVFSIYQQVQQQQNLEHTLKGIVNSFTGPQWWKLASVIVLMFFNWGTEAIKWQLLMNSIQKIPFAKAYKAVFSGQAFAFNTLNNVGEYVGRMMYLDEGNRLCSIALTMVGSMSQVIITFVMGLIGLLYMRLFIPADKHHLTGLSVFWFDGLMWGLLVGTIVLIIVYYALSWVTRMMERVPLISKYAYFIQKVEDLHWKELTRILFLSFIRYTIFILQYLLLLQVFHVEAGWLSLSWVVCVMFLVLAIVPSIAVAELGLRGEVSIQLLGLLSTNTIGIVFTATGIWFINRVIPALAGSLFILGVRLFKK